MEIHIDFPGFSVYNQRYPRKKRGSIMKKIVSTVLILTLVVCAFAACGVKPAKAIIGTWEGTKDLLIGEAKYTFTFNEEGKGTMSTPTTSLGVEMTYTIEEDVLTISTTVLGISNSNTYTVAFEDNKLILTSGDEVITLTKQAA